MRDPFTHGLYAEAGAMRIPRSHRLTLAYVEKFGLATHDFTMSNPEGWCHLFGRKHRFREVDADPHLIGAHLDERERGVTCAAMWERALDPFVKELAGGEGAWPGSCASTTAIRSASSSRSSAGRRPRSSSSAS